jgi:hypothetical protein
VKFVMWQHTTKSQVLAHSVHLRRWLHIITDEAAISVVGRELKRNCGIATGVQSANLVGGSNSEEGGQAWKNELRYRIRDGCRRPNPAASRPLTGQYPRVRIPPLLEPSLGSPPCSGGYGPILEQVGARSASARSGGNN